MIAGQQGDLFDERRVDAWALPLRAQRTYYKIQSAIHAHRRRGDDRFKYGRIPRGARWSDQRWVVEMGIRKTQLPPLLAAGLLAPDGDDLVLVHYDRSTDMKQDWHSKLQRQRANARWHPTAAQLARRAELAAAQAWLADQAPGPAPAPPPSQLEMAPLAPAPEGDRIPDRVPDRILGPKPAQTLKTVDAEPMPARARARVSDLPDLTTTTTTPPRRGGGGQTRARRWRRRQLRRPGGPPWWRRCPRACVRCGTPCRRCDAGPCGGGPAWSRSF